MASNNSDEKDKKKKEEIDVDDLLVGIATGLVIGAGAYGVYKLHQALSSPSQGPDRIRNTDTDEGFRTWGADRRTSESSTYPDFNQPQQEGRDEFHTLSGPNLQATLANVVRDHMGISGEAKHEEVQLSQQIASAMRQQLQKNVPQFVFPSDGNPDLIGSTSDGTMIQGKADCDYLLRMEIDPSKGQFVPVGGEEGYWKLQLMTTDPGLLQLWSKMTVDIENEYGYNELYLSPLKVHAFLLGQIPTIMRGLGCKQFASDKTITNVSGQTGPALKFQVTYISRYGPNLKSFDMDFVPCLIVAGKQLVGKRHPSLPPSHKMDKKIRKNPTTLRWRQSYSTVERDHIAELYKTDNALSKRVYRLVKFLRSRHSEFNQFSSFIYKNVFLYLLKELPPCEWREHKIAARFMDFMRKLEEVFNNQELFHYFLLREDGKKRNLLIPDYDPGNIYQFHQFLQRKNKGGEEAWAELFQNLSKL